jgi:hypothetical protein
MGAIRDMLVGLAETIAGSGIGVYRDDGSAYLATETAIIFGDLPPSPDRCIILSFVGSTSDMTMIPMSSVLVQARFRGLPNDFLDMNDLGDAVFDLLHGATNLTLGSTHAIQILRNGSAPGGMDASRRWGRYDDYLIDLDFPPTANRPAGGWD